MLEGTPRGKQMGHIVARRGHMALLPKGAAYQFHAAKPGVILLQSVLGDLTVQRCRTSVRNGHRSEMELMCPKRSF